MTNTLYLFLAILLGVAITGLIIKETVKVCTRMFENMLVGLGELLSGTGEGLDGLMNFKEEYDKKVIENYKKQNYKKEDP